MNRKDLSYGERAVGLDDHPSADPEVHRIKANFADLIDDMDKLRQIEGHGERKRLASIAITELQTAQMFAIKALTWSGID